MEQNKSYHKKEHIYSLEEKPEREISPLWQIVQVIFYLCSVISGFIVCYSFSNVTVIMNQNCILSAIVSFVNESKTANNMKSIDSIFHYQIESYCHIVTFIPVVITAFGSFFMVLFVICGRGGAGNKSLPDTWRIIMPSIIFNFISFGLALFTANTFESGMGQFLKNFSRAVGQDVFEIKDLSNMLYLNGENVGVRLVYFLLITKYAVRMLVSFWGLNFFWILLRCIFVVDFQLVRTTIHIYPRESNIFPMAARKSSIEINSLSNSSVEDGGADGIQRPDSAVRFRAVHFSPSTKDFQEEPNAIMVDASTSTSEFDEAENSTDLFEKKSLVDRPILRRKKNTSPLQYL